MASYSGTVKDSNGKEYSVSISLSEVVNPSPVEPAAPAKEEAEPGTVEAQEMPANGENV